MEFKFSRYGLRGREKYLERLFQIVPGLTSWTIILGVGVLCFSRPLWAAAVVIIYEFYWLLRIFYITIFLVLAYGRLEAEAKTDWMGRIREIDDLVATGQVTIKRVDDNRKSWKRTVSDFIDFRNRTRLTEKGNMPPQSRDIRHLVLIPIARESREVVEPGIRSFIDGTFPCNKIHVILSVEERAGEEIKRGATDLAEKYGEYFENFQVLFHPYGLKREARVKGANVTFAAKQALKNLSDKKIPLENVIVSCFDADTVVSRSYFACLTYTFMTCPDRSRASFQPIPVYHNNIWEVPSFARVLETAASFFQLTEATNAEKLVTFSSHSMSFKALVEVGFWPVDMISDDSAIFWKSYIHFEGDYRVVPMYVTLSMDVASSSSLWKTAVNVYKQKRRWAWGIENFSIVMRGFLKSKRISWYNKTRLTIKMLENHVTWATWPFLITALGWLPTVFAGREFTSSVLYYNAPRITNTVFHLASISLITSIVLSLLLLPKKKFKYSFWLRLRHGFEWLLVPAIAIFFSGLPALDAQTRLMFGKYMEFWVTEKSRKKIDDKQ